jgi:hypothetical protein
LTAVGWNYSVGKNNHQKRIIISESNRRQHFFV